MWKLPDGRVIRSARSFTLDGKQYPAQIFHLWTKDELNAIGVYPYREVGFNRVWYKSTGKTEEVIDGELVVTHTTAERYTVNQVKKIRVHGIREQFLNNITNAKQKIEFAQATEDTVEEQEWTDYLNALKAKALQVRNFVNNNNDYETLITAQVNWPISPDADEEII
jgi:hypothetical protein